MITLSQNKYLGAITNLVAYAEVASTLDRGAVGEFINSFQSRNVENGDGKVIRSVDLTEAKDLDNTTSSLLAVNNPTVAEQYIGVTNFKVIPVTINQYLARGAFVDEGQLASFVAYIMTMMEASKVKTIADAILTELAKYTPTQTTQTVTVHMFDVSNVKDPVQREAGERYNAKALQKALINTMSAMAFPTSKYNDDSFTEIIDNKSLKLIVKQSENTDMVVDSLAYLLNSDRITESQKWGETYAVPDEQFEGKDLDENVVAWLMDRNKIQFGYFYQVATAFFDDSNLNDNRWLHFSYYLDTVKALPAVVFKAVYDITPAALAA